MKYPINKEFFPQSHFFNPIRSARVAGWIGSLFKAPKRIFKDPDVKVTRIMIKGYQGGEFETFLYEPKGLCEPSSCIVYIHGGGFVFGAGDYNYNIAREYCISVGAKLLFINYRLAPKYPHPVPVEDCYAGLRYIFENADKHGIDRAKIGVAGESAGGALSAAVCLMARDRGTDKPAFQLLIYPATDITMNTESNKRFTDTPVWNSELSKMMWPAYVPDRERDDICYASPMQAEFFGDLPPAYVETAEFDCLHDEAIDYADAMRKAGVDVVINETKGTMHGFDSVANAPTTQTAIKKRVEFMKKHLDI